MSNMPQTVALTLCPAQCNDCNGAENLSGLFDIVERFGYEPSNYVYSPYFLVARVEDRDNDDAVMWDVDEGVLMEQVDPHAHGRMLAEERWCESDYDELEGECPRFPCPMLSPEDVEKHSDDDDKGHEFEPTGRQESHMDPFGGPLVGIELRCKACGLVRWDHD